MGVRAPVALRVNPDVDPQTHPTSPPGLKTSKFGVPYDEALVAYEEAAKLPGLEVIGADMHIGSQLTKATPGPPTRCARVVALVKALPRALDRDPHDRRRRRARHPLSRRDAADSRGVRDGAAAGARASPARRSCWSPVAPSSATPGVLLTRVLYRKDTGAKKFVVIDAAMNDLIRPSLYGSYHDIAPVDEARARRAPPRSVDVVGPICESGDFLAKDRELPRRAGRAPGPDERGRVRLRDGLQLQHETASRRGARGRQPLHDRAPPGDVRGPGGGETPL